MYNFKKIIILKGDVIAKKSSLKSVVIPKKTFVSNVFYMDSLSALHYKKAFFYCSSEFAEVQS